MRYIWIFTLAISLMSVSAPDADAVGTEALLGNWSGPAVYEGDSATLTLRFTKNDQGQVAAVFDLLITNIQNAPLGPVTQEGNLFKAGPVEFQLDEDQKLLHGYIGRRRISFQLKKDAALSSLSKLGPAAKNGEIAWTFQTDGAIWSSPTVEGRNVYFGSNDGNIYALETESGKKLWRFKTGGALYGRPTVVDNSLYMLSDDGYLYKLNAESGREIWRFDTGGGKVKRSPTGMKENDMYDNFTSGAVVANGVVYIGSASKKLYAVDEKTGKEKWEFQANDIIRSTPMIAEGLVCFGSWDHFVYAVDEETGTLKWKYDTGQVITSSPAYADGTIYIGSRSADIFALEAATGKIKWKYFYWYSWVESSGTVSDGVLYVGSSDYQLMFAIDTKSGKPIWSFDTDGSAWSSPAVTEDTVYIGTAGTVGYMADHRGGFFAVNRKDGKEKWRLTWDPIPNEFVYGVASSPAVGDGLVFFGGLDGKFYAVKSLS